MNYKFYDLTCPQKAILNMEQFYPNTSLNNISGIVTIRTKVDFSLLRKAIHMFVKNTNNIRYQFHIEQDVVKQYEKEYENFYIKHFEINSQNKEEIYSTISKKCFPLYDSPLYYFATFQNEDLTGGFFICVHHLIADAWAMSILINSVISIYSKLIQKESIVLDSNTNFSYIDFINQEKNYLKSPKFKQDENFWNNLFEDNIFEDLQTSYNLPKTNYEASRSKFNLSKKLTSKISDFCKQMKVSPFTFMLLIMGIYDSKVKQTDHIVLSTPILNRSGHKEKNTFGLFVNNMLYRLDINDSTSFYNTINTLNKSQFTYLRHQHYPLQNLISNIKSKYQIKENLYDTAVSYQNARTNHSSNNVVYDSEWFFNGYSIIPLLFHIYDMDDTNCFSFIYDYQNQVYDPLQIKDLHNRLLYICEQVINNPNILIKDIELSTQEEKNKILNEFNQTSIPYNSKKTILDLWNKQISKHPNKNAIICGDKKVTYRDLDQLSNQFAAYLQEKYNLKSGHNVSVILNRSIDLIVATLAILKCGCSYVLIDPSHAKDRQEYMVNNSESQYVISNLDLNLTIKNIIKWNLNSILKVNTPYQKPELSSNDPMYLLYTSGSTGTPKGVTVTHKNFHNYLLGISKVIDYSGNKTVLSMASISFDVFGYELWVTLLNGLTLILSTRRRTK